MKKHFEYTIIDNIENELFPILKSKSYNYDGKQKCAKLILDFLENIGLEVLFDTIENTSVICARTNKCSKNNILIYSHYDVKPVGCRSLWNTDPFEPVIINERIFCRGSGDAKCQIYSSLKAIEMLQKNHKISSDLGISLIFEDSEESDSDNLDFFCEKYHDFLNPLFVIVLDSHWYDSHPIIGHGCRGQLSYLLIEKEKEFDNYLHAGNYGGKYNGAAFNLISSINEFVNTSHIVEEYFNSNASFTISGFNSGNLKKGIIPAEAKCNIDMRLDKQNIYDEKKYINEFFQLKNVNVQYRQVCSPFISEIKQKHLKVLANTIFDISGIKPLVYEQINAYLPLEKLSVLNCPIYIVPLAQSDENNHAPNENMKISHIVYGIRLVYNMYLNFLGDGV